MFLFTIILSFSQPGHMAGELRVCVRATGPAVAAEVGLQSARKQLRSGRNPVVRVALSDGCPWMPDDSAASY